MVYSGKSHLEMDDLGVPLFEETTIYTTYKTGVGFYVPIKQIFHLQQIFEGDVQNPQKGTFTNPYKEW